MNKNLNQTPNGKLELKPEYRGDEEEGWGSYLLRNVAKTPSLLYKTARSGLHLGDLGQYIEEAAAQRTGNAGYPEAQVFSKARRALLPSSEEALQEYKDVLGGEERIKLLAQQMGLKVDDPRFLQMLASGELNAGPQLSQEKQNYLTASRPGDYPAELLLTELPFAAAGGAFKSGANLANYAARTGASLLGSELGGKLGGAIGSKLGSEGLGEIGGSILGSLGGLHAANKLLTHPLKTFAKPVYEAERGRAINEHKELAQRPIKIQEEIKHYDTNIKNKELEQLKAYNEAKKFRNTDTHQAEKVSKIAQQTKKNARAAIKAKDRLAVTEAANDVMEMIGAIKSEAKPTTLFDAHGKALEIPSKQPVPKVDLDKAILLKQNINDQIYEKGASKNLKKALSPLRDSLNEFIESVGSTEHRKAWKKSEDLTKEISELRKNRKSWRESKLTELREAKKEANKSKTQLDKLLYQMGKNPEAYLLKEATKYAGKPDFIERYLKSPISHLGHTIAGGVTGGLTSAAIGGGLDTMLSKSKINQYVSHMHPELFEAGLKEIKRPVSLKKTLPTVARHALRR